MILDDPSSKKFQQDIRANFKQAAYMATGIYLIVLWEDPQRCCSEFQTPCFPFLTDPHALQVPAVEHA